MVHFGMMHDLNILLSSLYAVCVFGLWYAFECRIALKSQMNESHSMRQNTRIPSSGSGNTGYDIEICQTIDFL